MARRKIGVSERKQILAIVKVGGSIADAAGVLGVTPKTVRNEMRRDPAFYLGVNKARKSGKMRLIKKVGTAKPWQAAAWMLERQYGSEYGRRERHEITGKGRGPIQVEAKRAVDYEAIESEIQGIAAVTRMARGTPADN